MPLVPALVLLASCQWTWVAYDTAPTGDTAPPSSEVEGWDRDGDGWTDDEDCADDDPDVHPGAEERCNGIDDDCDGEVEDLPCAGPHLAEAGRVLTGEAPGDGTGAAAAPVPDVDGDDIDELALSAPHFEGSGTVWWLPGEALVGESFDTCSQHATAQVTGNGPEDRLGEALAWSEAAGLLAVGAPGRDDETGAVYLVEPLHDGDPGDPVLEGHPGEQAGISLAAGGSTDEPRLLVGTASGSRAALLLAGPFSAGVSLTPAITWSAEEPLSEPPAVTFTGDLDGDGYEDYAIGLPDQGAGGRVAVVAGSAAPESTGDRRVEDHATLLKAAASGDAAGRYLGAPGDLTGDGHADLLVGAPGFDGAATDAGAIYLVAGPISVSTGLEASVGRIDGESAGDALGPTCDLDRDSGRDGLAIAAGAPGESTPGTDAGALYRVTAPFSGVSSVFDRADKYSGEPGEAAAQALFRVGDLDTDGQEELLTSGTPGTWDPDPDRAWLLDL